MSVPHLVTLTLAKDLPIIESLLDDAFGLSRQSKTSYRLREGNTPVANLSLVVRDAEVDIAGSISFWPLCIAPLGTPALLLGPLVVHRQRQDQGIGLTLMREGLKRAAHLGHKLVILVGDAPYYARAGFSQLPPHQLLLPGPVDPQRFLYRELVAGALREAHGLVLPPYRFAELSPLAQPGGETGEHESSQQD